MATKKRKVLAKRKVVRGLKKIDAASAAEVLSELTEEKTKQAEVEAEGRVPGRVLSGGTKTSFLLSDFEKEGVEEFVPEETMRVTLNGVSRQFISGVSGIYPVRFINQYKEIQRRKREKVQLPDIGFTNVVELGRGAFASEE